MQHKYFFSPFVDFSIGFFKTFWYYASLFLFTYLGIPEEALYLVVLLMGIDMFCGILKAFRVTGGNSITSHRATVWIIKKAIILIVIGTWAIILKLVGGIDPTFSLSGLLMMFWVAQGYSIIGNCYTAYTLDPLPEFEATGAILKSLGQSLTVMIEKFTIPKPRITPLETEKIVDIKPVSPEEPSISDNK